MINNNGESNVEIPNDIKDAIEKYKNQATSWGLECKRLEMLKSQTEISLSTLQSATADKNAKIIALDARIEKTMKEFESLKEQKNVLEKFIVDENKKLSDKEKDFETRNEVLTKKEGELRREEFAFQEKERIRRDEIKKLENEKDIVNEKKKLLSEVISKL